MIIKCTKCDFRFVSEKVRINELVAEKVDHEALTGHKVAYNVAIRHKLVSKENPENVYTISCDSCSLNRGLFVIYQTIMKIDANRFIEVHNAAMLKKEGKIYDYHNFNWNAETYEKFEKDIRSDSLTVRAMADQNLTPADIDMKERRFETGDQELAFYLSAAGSRGRETRIAYNIMNNSCPICQMSIIDELNSLSMVYLRYWKLREKLYDIAYVHYKDHHDNTDSTVENILLQCIIYSRNLVYGNKLGTTIRHIRRDKRSQALRSLNKIGIPSILLEKMFEIYGGMMGDMTYRGMELLGKPEWVNEVEAG